MNKAITVIGVLAGCILLGLSAFLTDKEGRACSHLIDLIGPGVNREQAMAGCRKGGEKFRQFRGQDAYDRHIDCILTAENLPQAFECDTIR